MSSRSPIFDAPLGGAETITVPPDQRQSPKPGNPMSTSSQFPDFTDLSVAERILLVEQIWDSIAAEQAAVPVTPNQATELDRRLDAFRKSPGQGASLEEVKARIQAKK
jgi:putative addiction module component (TIGR02574 family)